ncbi:enolase C-terminal domain-like protein [Prosthecodimorpha staleyi]|uniref:Cycloisomerase n=1 Tax=Prosthecodimorpha staleyi TaxID=2840188 RepID=A0A947D8A6_9HYPH|nr:enolase C-terminal domain-like protein [Prosthecodimorpha staleyi]MBT9289882.1 cycloisomerase [Prosthecodimorpha staleyi]
MIYADTIRALDVRFVRWPLKMKRRHGVGDVEKVLPGVVLRLEAEDGSVGWGEAAPWAVFSGTAEANAAAIDVYLRPLLIGRRASEVARIMDEAAHAIVGHGEAKAAVEMALYDLWGRIAGVPVAALLGGVFRDRIPLSVSIANPDFEADLLFLEERLADGVRLFKVKTGFLTHREDLVRLEALKTRLPDDAEIRIDYNQGLEPYGAVAKLRDMERFAPGFIEQPVKRDQRDAMGDLARAIDTPILADESVFSPAEAIDLVSRRYADAVSIKLMKAGGFTAARTIAAIAGAAGMPAYGGTMYEAGIALAAGIHLVAATPNICLGAEFYTSRYVLGVEILREPIRLDDGASHLPAGSGFGIEVDEEALASVTVDRRT